MSGKWVEIEDDFEVVERYRNGRGVDPLAGMEAVVSHLLVRHLHIPCAHAPAMASMPLKPNEGTV